MHHYPQIFRYRISQIRRTPTSKNREDFSRLPVKNPRASHGKTRFSRERTLVYLTIASHPSAASHSRRRNESLLQLIQFGAVRWGFTKGGIVHVSLAEWRSNTVMERTRRVLNSSISKAHPRFIAILTLFLPLSFSCFLSIFLFSFALWRRRSAARWNLNPRYSRVLPSYRNWNSSRCDVFTVSWFPPASLCVHSFSSDAITFSILLRSPSSPLFRRYDVPRV